MTQRLSSHARNKATRTMLPALIEAWPSLHWMTEADESRVLFYARAASADEKPCTLSVNVDGKGRWGFSLAEENDADPYLYSTPGLEMDKVHRHLYAWLCDEDGDYAEDEEFHATAEPFVDTYGVEP